MNTVVLILLGLSFTLAQDSEATATPCVQASLGARTYDDCSPYNNETAETICCLVQGTSGGTDGASCLDVDILFEGKTISYDNNGVSGQLICTSSTSSAGELVTSSKKIILFSSMILLFLL